MLHKIFEYAQGILAVASILAFLAGGLWFLVDDKSRDALNRFTGATEQRQFFEQSLEGMKRLDQRIQSIEERIDILDPSNRVFEVDIIRSTVNGVCPTNGECFYTLRTRRTSIGSFCRASTAERFVVDRFGTTHVVKPLPNSIPYAINTEWTQIESGFIIGEGVPGGVAEFYLELTYEDCFPNNPSRVVIEESPKLAFVVVRQPT